MRLRLPFALGATAIFLVASLPVDADGPSVIPLEVSLGDGSLLQACLRHLAEETPAEREALVASNIEFARRIHPGLDESGLRESAEMMVDDRCQVPDADLPPARKERVGDDWVVHVGEHSLVTDLYLNQGSGTPIHLVFFGIPFGKDAGFEIKEALVAADWQTTSCGGDHQTTLHDDHHGGFDQYINNRYHMQPTDHNCAGDRRHLKLWGSSTGDTHPGLTYGGYGVGTSHAEETEFIFWHAGGKLYDDTREMVATDLINSGRIDSWFYVNAGNTNPSKGAQDGKVLYLRMKFPAMPCRDDSVVRAYADVGYLGECRAFHSDDIDLANDNMRSRISSIKVASGYRAVLFENSAWTGATRSSRCSDNQFVQGGWNDRAVSLRVERVHNAPCYGTSPGVMPISNVGGSANYVQAALTSNWQPQALQVRAWDPNTLVWGPWYAMTKQISGMWTANPPTPSGSTVQLRALVGVGNGVDISPCYRWIPSGTPTQVYCPEPFKATFTDVRGNGWWVQASLLSNDHVDAVEYRVNCAYPYEAWTVWTPMQDQGWGWTASPGAAIPAGAKIDFRARGDRSGDVSGDAGGGPFGAWTSSEYDVSKGYTWPGGSVTQVAPQTTACFF